MKKIAFLFSLLLVFSSCEAYKDVKLAKFEDVRVKNIDGKEIDFEVDISLNNPNFYGIKVKDIKGELFVQNKLLGNVVLNNKVKIIRKSTNRYTIPLHIHLEEGVLIRFVQFALQKHVDLEFKGYAKGAVYGLPKTEKFAFNKSIEGRFFNIKSLLGK